ncbi:hypothetical protein BV898_07039 [Hypsibius exemplaris]|uniref:LRAT domain-containing protein n=1 Tax=Hypsibius exemplaris TaxID=2072580 RepID=A0A1W0WUV9_HYPEX|nr:hypothetical protein BV898_07039 [Hypsibius exemplaris]
MPADIEVPRKEKKVTPAMSVTRLLALVQPRDIRQFDVPEAVGKKNHWAVSEGKNGIIHFTSLEESPSSCFKDKTLSSAGDTLDGVNNWADQGYTVKRWFWQSSYGVHVEPFNGEEIVRRAELYPADQEKQISKYHLLSNKCEQFTMLCRHGKPINGQRIAYTRGIGSDYRYRMLAISRDS